MGCNVECPWLPCQFREDWGLDDPSGLPDEVFIQTQEIILEKIADLKRRLQTQEIVIK
jgi:arsenate reductase